MSVISKLVTAAAAGAGSESYWISAITGASGNLDLRDVGISSSGDVISFGYTDYSTAGSYDFLTVIYDKDGNVNSSNILGGTLSDLGYAVCLDSVGNIIGAGQCQSDGAGIYDGLIAKYDSSGTLLWDKTLGGAAVDRFYGVTVDSADNIIAVGQTGSDGAGDFDVLLAKYNSSGTLLWDMTLGGASADNGEWVCVDSSDNIIVAGWTQSDGVGAGDCLIAKYNSSGVLQWDRTLGGASADRFYGVAVDSSDNIIAVGYTGSQGAGSQDALIAKYNSSGVLQWQKILGGSSVDIFRHVKIDSSDNIFCVGQTSSGASGTSEILIAAYDSSGSLQWQKTLDYGTTDYGYSLALTPKGSIVICGSTGTPFARDGVVAKLPGDGSGSGTYGSYTYADLTLTSATSTLTDAAAVLTSAAAVLTDAAAVLTESTVSLTDTLTEVTP